MQGDVIIIIRNFSLENMAALYQRKIENKLESALNGSEAIGNDESCTSSPKETSIGSGDTKTDGKPTKKRGKGILIFLGVINTLVIRPSLNNYFELSFARTKYLS